MDSNNILPDDVIHATATAFLVQFCEFHCDNNVPADQQFQLKDLNDVSIRAATALLCTRHGLHDEFGDLFVRVNDHLVTLVNAAAAWNASTLGKPN